MTKMTITEGLAEIKTLGARMASVQQSVQTYAYRPGNMKDPFAANGGTQKYINSQLQSISDMHKRVISIRTAIQMTNLGSKLAIDGVERSIAEWLTWRREIAPGYQQFLSETLNQVNMMRREKARAGMEVVKDEAKAGDKTILVDIDETLFNQSVQSVIGALGKLDGQLSMFNATQVFELPD